MTGNKLLDNIVLMNTFIDGFTRNPGRFVIEVITSGTRGHKQEMFLTLNEARERYPELDPLHNGRKFTSGMNGGYTGVMNAYRPEWNNMSIIRFEDWEVNKELSI